MTNEELFQDLKQFITATVSQQMAHVATKDDIQDVRSDVEGLSRRLTAVESKLDQVQDAIADTLTQAAEATDATLQDHDKRLRRLEHRAA